MTCTRCAGPILRGDKYHRTKKGAHHAVCPEFTGAPSIKSLAEASANITAWLRWDLEVLEDAHRYGQMFGRPGANVYRRILEDALQLRGMTLDQLRSARP